MSAAFTLKEENNLPNALFTIAGPLKLQFGLGNLNLGFIFSTNTRTVDWPSKIWSSFIGFGGRTEIARHYFFFITEPIGEKTKCH